ncbi:hypothetical protein FGRMN_6159 [Fusarium graminum]|nr:hypothetical protein FGRMN_6159 [Fusarium graminum]
MDPNTPLPSNPNEDGATDILAATLFIVSLATVVVFARIWVRMFIIRSVGWDDALMILTLVMDWVGQGIVIASVKHGAGKHVGDVDPAVYMVGMKLNFISQPIFLLAICLVKLAVGCALLRISSTKFYRRLILSIMCFMTFYTVGCFFTIMLQCTDIHVLWDPTVKATCWSQKTLQSLSYTNSTLNILTDLLFAIIVPAPMLWKLNVHFRTRMTLLAILGLGVFACAAAFIKTGYLANYGKVGDWLWDSRNITIWTSIELNVGIIAGSLPCLKPLFRRFLGSIYGNNSKKTPGSGPPNYGHGSAYARGTMRSNKSWHALGSGRRGDDETSSQRGINNGVQEEYELHGKVSSPMGFISRATVMSDTEGRSSADSEENPRHRGQCPVGITKTTTTTVNITKKDYTPSP